MDAKSISVQTRTKHRYSQPEVLRCLKRDRVLWMLVLPCIAYFIIFCYIPMGGLTMAFQNYRPVKGFFGSEWVGLKHFQQFFTSPFFPRLVRNTILISVYGLLWGFPIPILFALFLNELRPGIFKKTVQTVSYMPHFISTVVLVGIVQSFLSPYEGIVNTMITTLGGQSINFWAEPGWFRTIYIGSGIWQNFGYNSIIYLSAISAVDPQLYEAARIDGAKRFQIMFRITLPCILPTAIIMLILNCGSIMNVGFEKINLLYSPATYETADVISTYVYRQGIVGAQWSYSTAVGMFNSVINLLLIIVVNRISRKLSDISLW